MKDQEQDCNQNKIVVKTRNINKKLSVETEIKIENKRIDFYVFCKDKFFFFKTINFKDKSKDKSE